MHLVRAGSDYVLLGSTEHGVAPIHRYTEEEARDAGLLFPEPPPERSRLASAASQIVAGTGRAVGQGRLLGGQGGESPVVGRRPDPMRMSSPSSGVIERLRELTVRR